MLQTHIKFIKQLTILVLILGSMLVVSCGGGGSSAPPSTPTPTSSSNIDLDSGTHYVRVTAYSTFSTSSAGTPQITVVVPLDANNISQTLSVKITWETSRETSVTSTGGGYKIHHSTTSGFAIGGGGVTVVDLPSP